MDGSIDSVWRKVVEALVCEHTKNVEEKLHEWRIIFPVIRLRKEDLAGNTTRIGYDHLTLPVEVPDLE